MVATGEQNATLPLLPSACGPLYESTATITSIANRIAEEWRTPHGGNVHTALKSDLRCLIEGTVKCTKPKPPSTKETKKEAFDRYMKIIYRVPYNIEVEFDDDSDEITFESDLFANTTYITSVAEDTPPPVQVITSVKTKEKKLRVVEKKQVFVDEGPKEEPEPEKPPLVIHEKPKIILPKFPKPKPAPAQKPLALPPREPSPEPPPFLQEFLKKEWFKQLYSDKKKIPTSLCPDSFFLQLCDYLCTCNPHYKSEILSVLETLHRRKLLQNVDQLYQKLLGTVPKMVTTNMGVSDRASLVQLLNLLTNMKSVNEEIVKTLLTLAAYKELRLRERILQILKSFGVDEAEQWLWPELESWQSELPSECNMWKSLYVLADSWLRLWTSKYKANTRDLFLRSTGKWKPPSFTVVDVVNHFCSEQKEKYLRAKQPAQRVNNTVLLPHDCVTGPIHRLGETYTMARIRKPSNLILPPLRDRPFLLDFPHYLTLPLPRVRLSPFYSDLDEKRLKFLDHRYYIPAKSHVEYYR